MITHSNILYIFALAIPDLLSSTDLLIRVRPEKNPPLKQVAGIEELKEELSVFFKTNDYSIKLSNSLFSN